MITTSLLRLGVFTSLCLALLLSVPAPAFAYGGGGTDGRNVTMVQTPEATYTLTPGKQWVETGSGGGTFNFVEQQRDDWSVYLFDASRSVNLQLDLHTKTIYYSDANSPRRPLYKISSSSSVVNGRNVTSAKFNGGKYVMTGANAWAEQGSNGSGFSFVEDNRDDWSVYLSDASRGVRIQIDIHRKLVLYADQGAPAMRPLYPIIQISALAN